MCVCVSIRLIVLLILQHAKHKCVMSAGMFDLCYPSDKGTFLEPADAIRDREGHRRHCAICVCVCVRDSSRPTVPSCVFMHVCVCVCVDRVFSDTDE